MSEAGNGLMPQVVQQLAAIAQDLYLLARFHDRELDVDIVGGLLQHPMAQWLSIELESEEARKAVATLDEALNALPVRPSDEIYDQLAVDFADVYLTHRYRVAPTGSVWLTEDHLERQAPMFAVREWYQKYEMEVSDWRLRSDDHIVHELQFLAHLCELGTTAAARDADLFLDQHVLNWVPDFARAICERCPQPIYVASAALTAAYLEELRDYLSDVTGIVRPVSEPEMPENVVRLFDIDRDRPYTPGADESW